MYNQCSFWTLFIHVNDIMQYLTNLLGIEKWQRTATSFTHSFGSSFLSFLLGQSLVSVRLGGYSSFHLRDFMISLLKSLHSLKSKYSSEIVAIFILFFTCIDPFWILVLYDNMLFVRYLFRFVFLSANNIGSWHGQEMWVEQSSKVILSFLRRCKEGSDCVRWGSEDRLSMFLEISISLRTTVDINDILLRGIWEGKLILGRYA